MSSKDPIPEHVARFLDSYVESIEQLEILRILGESPHLAWNAVDLARDAQIQPDGIAAQLQTLELRGLIRVHRHDGVVTCQLGASDVEKQQQLQELLRFYRERPVTLIKAVYHQAHDRLRAFADAFRLRKES